MMTVLVLVAGVVLTLYGGAVIAIVSRFRQVNRLSRSNGE
jgi:hypothetical protein